MSVDRIQFIGNLGRDPEMRYTPQQKKVTAFSVATNRRYTTSDGREIEETRWHRVETWGKLAELCNKFLKSGSKVYVEGKLKADPETGGPRIYTRKDGEKAASFEVLAEWVDFLDPKEEGNGLEANPEEDFPF